MSKRREVNIGEQFNELRVLDLVYLNGVGFLKVECSCGNIEIKRKWPILSGRVKECCKCTHKIISTKRRKGKGDISGRKWASIRGNAKQRNLEFTVSIDYVLDLIKKQNYKCALTDLDITLSNDSKEYNTASLDRIDSLKGYIEGNLQWVHRDINYMKQEYSQEYFINLCRAVNSKCGG